MQYTAGSLHSKPTVTIQQRYDWKITQKTIKQYMLIQLWEDHIKAIATFWENYSTVRGGVWFPFFILPFGCATKTFSSLSPFYQKCSTLFIKPHIIEKATSQLNCNHFHLIRLFDLLEWVESMGKFRISGWFLNSL